MEQEQQLQLQAYLDNELSGTERQRIERWLDGDQEARELLAELNFTHTTLIDHEPLAVVPATREFYWSQISQQIELAERQSARRFAQPAWWLRYFSPAAALALTAGILFTLDRAYLGDVADSAEPEGNSVVFRSEAEEMTVVWLHSHNKDFTSSDLDANTSVDDRY